MMDISSLASSPRSQVQSSMPPMPNALPSDLTSIAFSKAEALAKGGAWQRRRSESGGGSCSRRQGPNRTKPDQLKVIFCTHLFLPGRTNQVQSSLVKPGKANFKPEYLQCQSASYILSPSSNRVSSTTPKRTKPHLKFNAFQLFPSRLRFFA